MRINEVNFDKSGPNGQVPIDSYGPGFFRINDQIHHGPLALLPDRVTDWPGLHDFGIFAEGSTQFDVLFVGTGADIQPLSEDILAHFAALSIGVEIMSTPSACRTYNVLLAEGRRIAAAFIPI